MKIFINRNTSIDGSHLNSFQNIPHIACSSFHTIMAAKIGTIPTFVFCVSICTINAFSLNSNVLKRKDSSCCQSSISLDDDRSRLPTGAFGITTASQEAVIDTSGSHHSADYSSLKTQVFDVFDTTSSPLIPISRSTSSPRVEAEAAEFYDNDLDLPSHSRVSSKLLETTAAIELSLSRIAMIAAIGLVTVEITTGTSFADQILRVIQ